MTAYSSPISLRQMALLAGFSLLLMAVLAGFAYGYVFGQLYVPENPAATLANVQNAPLLLRLFVFSFVLILLLDVLVAWALFHFFEPVDKAIAQLTACLRLIYATLLGIALSPLSSIWSVPNGNPQYAWHVVASFETFREVWSLGLLVFGCHLAGVSWLMFRARFIPRLLAFLTMVAAICYVATSCGELLLLNYHHYKPLIDQVLALPMALGELGLALWLVVYGGRTHPSI